MVWRIAVTVVSWALGLAVGLLTDGRPFDGLLRLLVACAVASLPWLWLQPPTKPAARRLGVVVLCLNAAAFVLLLVNLPESHRVQKTFEARATSALYVE